jgi:hypothetical protein
MFDLSRKPIVQFVAVNLLLAGLFSLPRAEANDVTIHVKNKLGQPAVNTVVYAIRFGEHGPDGSESKMATTDKRGNAKFKLDGTKEYEIIADKHGLGPTARAQIFNLSRLHLPAGAKGKSELVLGEVFENRGLVAVTTRHATPNKFIIGSLRSNTDGKDVAFAGNMTDAKGNTILVFNNIPPSDANAYAIDIYDPSGEVVKNKHYAGRIGAVMSDERTSVALDLANTQSALLMR